VVVCSPTGSGKTVVFELAIIRLLMNFPDRAENFKIVYSKYWWVLITVASLRSRRYLRLLARKASRRPGTPLEQKVYAFGRPNSGGKGKLFSMIP
jgi:ATP-dependent helicase YprA (DUF1998 family)